jgi:hypothetical protein
MLPPHKWEINVSAGSYYPDLTQNFLGNDIDLCYDNDDDTGMRFFAYSRHIDELDNPKHVAQRLYSLQLLLNGALRVSRMNVHPIPISFLEFSLCNSGGSHAVYAEVIEDFPFSTNPAIDSGMPEWNKPQNLFASYLVYLAKSDSDLRCLLFLAGLITSSSAIECILTWGTLYKILDSVRHISKRDGLAIESFADMSRVNEFTAACNNMSVLGLYSRHGAAANKPPTKVITDLQEAIGLIISLECNFCKAYVNSKYP